MSLKNKWSRKRWIAETNGDDLAEYSEYQPSLRGREKRLPIYSDGILYVCQFPDDSAEKLKNALDGRVWKSVKSWRDNNVIIHREIVGAIPE